MLVMKRYSYVLLDGVGYLNGQIPVLGLNLNEFKVEISMKLCYTFCPLQFITEVSLKMAATAISGNMC